MTDSTFNPNDYTTPDSLRQDEQKIREFYENALYLSHEIGIDPRLAFMAHVHFWTVPSVHCTGNQ